MHYPATRVVLTFSQDQSALSLSADLATSGTSHPDSFSIPALVPPPIHIEAVSVLLVHPEYTTRSSRNDRAELASRSIAFLRSVLSNIGPLNANLAEAFSFTPPDTRGRRQHGASDPGSSDDEEETSRMKGVIMNKGRIRNCATDFWHVVGWALNCSVVHRERWRYWKTWLDYMLDVLQADWDEREAQDRARGSIEEVFGMRKQSLLMTYLAVVRGRSSALKRVVDSIFVDGGAEDLKAYPEIFANETMELKTQSGHKRKREDDFGGFEEEDADLEPDFETPTSSQETDENLSGGPDPWLGGYSSITIRQRLLMLVGAITLWNDYY